MVKIENSNHSWSKTTIHKVSNCFKGYKFHNQSNNFPIEEVIIHTGQHFDKNMSEVFFKELDIIEPEYNLNIKGLDHGAMTGRMMEEIEKALFKFYLMLYLYTATQIQHSLEHWLLQKWIFL